ncbi:mechanosensitive ion channel domain-containing protein [Euzebya tangerina]|uniref:mechanosensitive ion channel domain-containing protein n=1 Tax=Euzebya tangerina TaxID=591198 RepID=UPI000E322A6F|nr:mechanosensitive ion channel domain-containing protein [Euzebya tangerina]
MSAVLAAVVPVVVCVAVAICAYVLVKLLGGRLLDNQGEVDSLARTAFVVVTAVGVLLGIGRLVGREATDRGLEDALSGIVGALPGLTISFILVIGALLVAAVVRAAVQRLVGAVRPAIATAAGTLVYWSIVILVGLIAIEQAGIDIAVLRQILLLVLAATLAAAALGVGLGMRELLSAVIAGRHVDTMLRVGQSVTIGRVTGEVLKVGHVSVEIRDDTGTIHDVPHTHFLEDGSARTEAS